MLWNKVFVILDDFVVLEEMLFDVVDPWALFLHHFIGYVSVSGLPFVNEIIFFSNFSGN
jgi:hypothetical protein